MKVTLIRYHDKGNVNTRLPDSLNRVQGVLPPLGIAYVASSLEKEGHKVDMIDAQAERVDGPGLRKMLTDGKPDIVGVTTMTPNVHGALEACRIAKESGAKVVIGGVNVEIFPQETMSYAFIDFGVAGEGERAMCRLAASLETGSPYQDIPGLVFRKEGQLVVNPIEIIDDIDSLPWPARHLLPMERYSSIIGLDKATTLFSSRGCPYRCAFCFKQAIDRKIRFRNPVDVVDEMEMLHRDYGIMEAMFYDDTITTKRDHMEGICRELIKRKLPIRWESPARVNEVDEDLLRLMKESGCMRLRYGVESGDPAILELMNKRTNLELVRKVFSQTRAAGIETFAYFMVGYYSETKESFRKTLDLAHEIKPDLVMFTVTTPCPDTPLFDLAVKEGLAEKDYWSRFILGETTEPLPPFCPDAEERVKAAYRSFYLKPSYVIRKLMKINSWPSLKKHIQAGLGILLFNMKPGKEKSGSR